MEIAQDAAVVESRVRAAVAYAMRVSLDDWPAGEPLHNVPDGIYDSLAQLEAIVRLERDLDSGPLTLDQQAGELITITALTEWVVRKLGERG
ncbi:hypothetical protein ACGFYV_14075 [Streptomyces sp. NPDC048297]|uniref:hypothetical protein n=1 Tax=Streptomyces sp. NPDC048297 TaxID=3365531 RepID=UPI003716D7D3